MAIALVTAGTELWAAEFVSSVMVVPLIQDIDFKPVYWLIIVASPPSRLPFRTGGTDEAVRPPSRSSHDGIPGGPQFSQGVHRVRGRYQG
ncbi:hypothetical protein GCM10023346_04750 [Arthrobacter gyeryongensis]|uniref:Uncharacterized protein n=1 Tax=Arthrobacter gyeryongensis TaxID=1650592 RepID=A0ABP9S1A6_9MICC